MEAQINATSPLRQRMIDDMRMRKFAPKTQQHYVRAVRRFADSCHAYCRWHDFLHCRCFFRLFVSRPPCTLFQHLECSGFSPCCTLSFQLQKHYPFS